MLRVWGVHKETGVIRSRHDHKFHIAGPKAFLLNGDQFRVLGLGLRFRV